MSDIINIQEFKNKKLMDDKLAHGRTPLYVSHLTGKVSGNPSGKSKEVDFGDRLYRIRTSLQKINRLMAELKGMSDETNVLHGQE